MITNDHITTLRKTVRAIRNADYMIAVRDDEGCFYKANRKQTERDIIDAATAVDECHMVVISKDKALDNRRIGTALVVWDVDDDESVIADYSESLTDIIENTVSA